MVQTTNQTIKELRDAILSCKDCSLHSTAVRPVGFSGRVGLGALFVLGAPDQYEDKKHIPGGGANGIYIRKILDENQVDVKEVGFTYAVSCYPGEKGMVNQSQLTSCGFHLHTTIQNLAPKLVVIAGELAWKSLRPGEHVTLQEARGHYWELGSGSNALATAIELPTEAFHDAVRERLWLVDMGVVARVIADPTCPPRSQFCLKCGSPDDLEPMASGGLPVCQSCIRRINHRKR